MTICMIHEHLFIFALTRTLDKVMLSKSACQIEITNAIDF